MATFNSSPNLLNSCAKSTEAVQSTAAFFVPSPSPLLGLNYNSTASSAIENHSYIGIQQKNIPSLTHHHVNSSSSFTFMEIKREPCQVSEVTTSNNLHTNHHNSKSMSSTMTTLVKIESTSPKMSDMDKSVSQMNNNSMPVGVTVTRKRPQDSTPVQQPSRDINYFGIRVADIGGVAATGCGNIYFAGADLMPGANNEDMNSIHNTSRSASTFWQYPNAFPLESVISMSPVGLQYARDPSRGQLVLLPTTSAMESFPQAAFLWPPYMQQNPGALQTTPNFLFPSMNPQASAPTQSYTAPIQLLGSNYLTATAASSTVCHHSQANGSRFLSISSDTRRTEQSQKHNGMKKDDWLQQNNLNNKGYLTSNFDATSKAEKSKDDESTYSQSNANLIGPTPLMPNEESHNILLNNTHSPSELLTMPMIPANYTIPPNATPLTPPQMGEVNNMYKNSATRVSSFSKTPEMQDVNIQTDTPVCSDDENSTLEVSTGELIASNVQSSDKIKSMSTQCHNNYNGCKGALPKETSTDSLQQYNEPYDFSKPNTPFTSPDTFYENECVLNRPTNKNDSYNPADRTNVLPSAACNSESSAFKAIAINPPPPPPPLLEMSGLELLSNISTGSFVNHDSLKTVRVKQEPPEIIENERRNESFNNYESYNTTSCNNLEMQYADTKEKNDVNELIKSPSPPGGGEKSLGGLNLLCALAEQRIQEEVESNNFNNNPKEPSPEVKKRKHKHSKSKSSRHSRYYKESKKKLAKERKGRDGLKSDCDDVHDNLRSAFEKVDPNYKKINKWPDPEDFFKAMESDMRMRLADITRQYRKKKRKLDEINKIKKRKKTSEYKFANISCKNPSFICFLDKFQSTPSNFPPCADEIEQKSLNIQNKNITDCAVGETSEDNEEISASLEGTSSSIKFNTTQRQTTENIVLSEKKRCKNKKYKRKHIPTLKVDRITLESRSPIIKSQQQKQNIVIKEENKFAKKIDKELLLSNEHLYREETRVLTDMGGLFYAGILKPLQPPDVYAITLDGERGNKSHIMSREEIFKDTILEVVPKNIENVPTGTRLCAYWSQQYRCLYPGKAIDSDNADAGSDFVSVEFDDGDSGRIRLQNIRYLLSDYPTVEYNENPFNTLGKNKKSSSIKTMSTDTTSNDSSSNRGTMRKSVIQETDRISFNHRIDKNRKQFDKIESHLPNLNECVHKHTKHRKKKKHKKHHRKSSPKCHEEPKAEEEEEENTNYQNTELQSFNYNNELKSNLPANDEIIESERTETIVEPKTINKLLVENVKHEINGLDDEDSTSNVVSETSDEAKNERIDYNSGKGSKIAAFLPERQLWGWLGQTYRKAGLKGRARKQFYKSISRGKETITVGECAVFLSTGRPDRPYIGRIEAMWETTTSNKIVRVRWFYHPEETTGCPNLKYPGALFDSPHEDENDVQTISHRCEVVEFSVYIAKFGSDTTQYQSIYDNNDTYYLSGYYNPRLQVLKMQPDIPTLDDTSL